MSIRQIISILFAVSFPIVGVWIHVLWTSAPYWVLPVNPVLRYQDMEMWSLVSILSTFMILSVTSQKYGIFRTRDSVFMALIVMCVWLLSFQFVMRTFG